SNSSAAPRRPPRPAPPPMRARTCSTPPPGTACPPASACSPAIPASRRGWARWTCPRPPTAPPTRSSRRSADPAPALVRSGHGAWTCMQRPARDAMTTPDPASHPVPSSAELRAAADRLVSALAAHADPEYRLTVLKRLVRRLGEERYPLFLRLVGVVAESDDARAQGLLADTFGTALRRMDMPGGALSSWGAARLPDPAGPMAASAFSGHFFGAT